MKRLLIVLIGFITIQLHAQVLPDPLVEWEKSFGGKRYDEATDIIENKDGNLVLIGQCKNLDNKKDKSQKDIHKLDKTGNSDVLFLVINPKGEEKNIKAIGRSKSERGNAIVQTFDGGYAIAGFTNSEVSKSSSNSQALGLKDAWLLKVDEQGNYLWEIRLGSAEQDWFTDVIQDDEGNLFLTGTKNGKLFLAKVDQYGALIWEKTPLSGSKTETRGNALIQLSDKDIAIVGISKKGANENAIFLKTSTDGTVKGEPVIYKADYEEATDIIQTKDNKIVILSKTFNKKKTDHVGVRITNVRGKLLTEEQFRFGDRQKDFPFSITQSFSEDLFISGGSKSHSNTGVRYMVFLSRIGLNGKSRYEKWAQFYGGNATDKANKIIQTSDGSIYMAGHTFSEKVTGHNSNVYVVKIKSDKFPSSDKARDIVVENKVFVDPNGDQTLDIGERSYYKFQISNNGTKDAYDITAAVSQTSNLQKLVYPKKITLGYLPAGHSKTFSIPIKGMEGLSKGEATFGVSFTEANSATINPFEFKIKTKNEPTAILTVVSHDFSKEKELQRETPITLQVVLKNTGDKTATSLRGVFSFEKNVINISDKVISIPELKPNEEHVFAVDFNINKVYQGDNTKVGFRFYASEENYFSGVQDYYPLQTDLEFLEYPALVVSDYKITPDISKIQKGEEVDIKVFVKNTGQIAAYDLQGVFTHDASIESLSQTDKKYSVIKGGETKSFTYNCKVKEKSAVENTVLSFSFNADEKTLPSYPNGLVERFEFSFENQIKPALLSVNNHSFNDNAKTVKRGEEVLLTVELANDGGESKPLVANFKVNDGVLALSEQRIALLIGENKTKELKFRFNLKDDFEGERILIPFTIVDENGTETKLEKEFVLSVEQFDPPKLLVKSHSFEPKIAKIGDEITLKLTLENIGELAATGLKYNFQHAAQIKGITKNEGTKETIAPSETATVKYTFVAQESFDKDIVDIKFGFVTNENEYKKEVVQNFQKALEELVPPILVVDEKQFISKVEPFKRGEEITLEITLENQGERTATNLKGLFELNDQIIALTEEQTQIDKIEPNKKGTFSFTFKVKEDSKSRRINIPFLFSADDKRNQKQTKIKNQLSLDKFSPALLVVSKSMTTPEGALPRETAINLSLMLKNSGGTKAKNVIAEFLHNDQIEGVSKTSESIDEIDSEKSKLINYVFKVADEYEEDKIKIKIRYKFDQSKDGKFEEEILTYSLRKRKPISLEIVNTMLEPAGYLQKRDSEIAISVELMNTGGKTAKGVEGIFDQVKGVKSLSTTSSSDISIKPGERYRFVYRFKIEPDYDKTLIEIPFNYLCKSKQNINGGREIPISLNAIPPPQLLVTRMNQTNRGADEVTAEGLTLTVEMKNNGSRAATGIRGTFSFEKNIVGLSDKEFKIAKLAPGESKLLSFNFKPNDVYQGNTTNINFRFQGNEKPYLGGKRESFLVYLKKSAPVVSTIFDYYWEAPLENKRIIKGLGDDAHLLEIKLDIFTNVKVQKEKFEVYLDGVLQKGSKAGEDDLIPRKSGRLSASSGKKYEYSNKVLIPAGEHTVVVKYKDGKQEYSSEMITVSYKPKSLNLHLLAIGINKYDDERNIASLKYPSQDVRDMAKIFKSQEGKLFDEVHTTLVCDDCDNSNTTKKGLEKALSKFSNDKDEKFGDNDLVVIYISSHGKDFNGNFKILPSDYERDIEDVDGSIHTVDFEEFVIKKLKRLDGNHKFLFVDACHSGAAGEDLDNFNLSKSDKEIQSLVLKQLIDKARSINPMMSCLDYERSWEHPDWKNGAFTEGMIEAFSNKEVPINKEGKLMRASEDDTILTFGELYRFLQARVPFIVQDKFKNSQTPYIPKQLVNEVDELQFYITN